MDEIEIARRAYGDPPDDPEARARARVRLRVAMRPPLTPAGLVETGPRRRVLVLAVVLALLALLGGLVLPASQPSAVASELSHLREVLVVGPLLTLAPGTSLQVRAESVHAETHTDLVTGQSYALIVRSNDVSRIDRDGAGLFTQTIEQVGFATPADRASWQVAGSPQLPRPGDVHRKKIRPGQALWYDVGALSTDPNVLLERLRGGAIAPGPPGDDQVAWLIGQLLGHAPLGLPQRLALLDVIGRLRGVAYLGQVTDPTGQRGAGFSVMGEHGTSVLLLDTSSARVLASETYPVGAPLSQAPSTWVAFGSTRIVPTPP
jgi:hypothetical protein